VLASPTAPDPTGVGWRLTASAAVAVVAFACYYATLLPGLDFGDTAAYQASVGDWRLTPRQAYPLYYAIANLLYAVTGGDPARSLNLTSALMGALACGATVWLVASLSGSLVAGGVSGLLLLSSYTFWSQAIIGEVYTLHVLVVSLVLIAAVACARRPTPARLSIVLFLYAIGFGNHLMMILLLPALTVFLTLSPGGGRLLWSPRGMSIAAACAVAGASLYLWNASYLWQVADPPPGFREGAATFWFDVTKSDWRSSMVMAVHESALKRRVGLYWFDLVQQVGIGGVVLAAVGLLALLRTWRVAVLVTLGYIVAFAFAYTYNVGDVHVFFLPSHHFVIIAAGAGVVALAGLAGAKAGRFKRHVMSLVLAVGLLYPAWRTYDTWPAVDRHEDRRPQEWLDGLTAGLGENDLLLADLNWQLDNGLDYYTRHLRPDLNVVRAAQRVLSLPVLVADNLAAGRSVVVSPLARDLARSAYGDLFAFTPDPRAPARSLEARLQPLPPGSLYVIALLAPYRDLPFDGDELDRTARLLTGGATGLAPGPSYQVLVGLAGEAPLLARYDDRPFRTALTVGQWRLDLRMESWLPADTMRRAGFGQVIVNRRHRLTLERGVSVLVLRPDGSTATTYASGLFAPLVRERLGLAAGGPAG
jgi:hypothetical protein